MSRRRRSLTAAFAAALLGAGLALATAGPAYAHDELVSSYPTAGSTLTGSPAEITLSFSGELMTDMQSAVAEVIAPNGDNIATDDPDVSTTSFTQHLAADPPDGIFTVRWKVVSSDGHPISGEYTYTVQALATETPATSPTPNADAADAETATSTQTPTASEAVGTSGGDGDGRGTSGGGDMFAVGAVFTLVIILGGMVTVVLMVARERHRRDRVAERRAAQQASSISTKDATDEP